MKATPRRVRSHRGDILFTSARPDGPALLPAWRVRARRAQPRACAPARGLGRHGAERQRRRGSATRAASTTTSTSAPWTCPRVGHDPMLRPPCTRPTRTVPGAPDRVFGLLDDDAAEHQVTRVDAGAAVRGRRARRRAAPASPHAALRGRQRAAPGVPIVGHLHGTELLMLEAIEADPQRWPHGLAWAERLRDWALQAERLIVLSESADRARRARAAGGSRPLHAGPERLSTRDLFSPGARSTARRIVGADAAPTPASKPTRPVLLYVGRFTEVKRVPLLIEAYERARPGFSRRAPLVLVGGFPGECEGEHPRDSIAPHRRAGRPPRRLARPRRAAGHPRARPTWSCCRGARAVRPGPGRGDGLRAAGDRRRRARPGGHRRPRRDGLAGGARRRRTRSPTRSWRPSTARRSAAGAARTPPRTSRERYAWPRLAQDVADAV